MRTEADGELPRRVRWEVALSPDEVVDALQSHPRIAGRGGLALEHRWGGIIVRFDRDKPPFETYEVLPLQLHVRLRATEAGTQVRAFVRSAPRRHLIAAHVVGHVLHGGLTLVSDLVELSDVIRRRRAERTQLYNVLAESLGRHVVGARVLPYR